MPTTYSVELDEFLTANAPMAVGSGVSVSDQAFGTDTLKVRLGALMGESGALSVNASYSFIANMTMDEIGRLNDIVGPASAYTVQLNELATVDDDIYNVAYVLSVSEAGGLTDFLNSVTSTTMSEKARGSVTLTPQSQYHMAVDDALFGHDALIKYLGATLNESGALAGTFSKTYIGAASLTENGVLQGYMTMRGVFRPEVSELGEADDTLAPQTIFDVQYGEAASMSVAYCSPSGSTTTWAMNTRTNALTEYWNWNFNSFTNMGRKYIAANSQGLYELDGDRDVTTNIMAYIAGGSVQFNGAKFAGLKGVYIGMNAQGMFLLKLVAGDGRQYIYQTAAQPNYMTSKVTVGKGLRSRYFQWELVMQGPDFDIDTVEFIPMVSDRRV